MYQDVALRDAVSYAHARRKPYLGATSAPKLYRVPFVAFTQRFMIAAQIASGATEQPWMLAFK
jgi:hypothetical protein